MIGKPNSFNADKEDRRSNQPYFLKSKPNLGQGSNSHHFSARKAERGEKTPEKSLKLAEVGS